ncbi:MAG TPA: hypothetical protein VNI01_07040 [Elusimicrobiota bacterium]|jgi:hypothetical protein|nr:hypothetical protein [Elusimicrobiota bacterium]
MTRVLLAALILIPAAAFAEPPAESPVQRFQRFLSESSKAFQALGMGSAAGPGYQGKDADQINPPAPAPSPAPRRPALRRAPAERPSTPYPYKDADQTPPAPPAPRVPTKGDEQEPARPAPPSPSTPAPSSYPSKDADQMPTPPPPPPDTSKGQGL